MRRIFSNLIEKWDFFLFSFRQPDPEAQFNMALLDRKTQVQN